MNIDLIIPSKVFKENKERARQQHLIRMRQEQRKEKIKNILGILGIILCIILVGIIEGL